MDHQGGDQPASPAGGNSNRNPGLFRNTLSLTGAALAAVSLANIVFLFVLDALSYRPSPYIGIFAYMVMPAFLILGLLLIPAGMLRERHRRRKYGTVDLPRFPRIDLNDPRQRGTLMSLLSFVVVFGLLSAVGSYRAYEFTDSVQFCGQLCHTVMHPEFVAYSLSPHARVRCVDCHVGAGASWYVRSKLSGTYQVYATVFHTYPQPIPTPVANLRPAQETCEECHWPRKFYGDQFKVITAFGYDEKNTPQQVRLLIRTGGADPLIGVPTGIHWHMNIGNEITYAVTDPKRLKIDWVQIKSRETGQITVYKARDAAESDAQLAAAPKHRMDCVDCHNRPTHIYVPPDRSVDESLLAARLDPTMPFIKQQAVTALTGDYKTTAAAEQGIGRTLRAFYAKYPAVQPATLNNAIREVQRIYSTTIFPEMKVDWRTHPDNIGHYYFPGCFRCHDGQHVSSTGQTIPNGCNVCHFIVGQESGSPRVAISSHTFNHPGGELPEGIKCMDCHTGGVGP